MQSSAAATFDTSPSVPLSPLLPPPATPAATPDPQPEQAGRRRVGGVDPEVVAGF